jgi:hypothetical protein
MRAGADTAALAVPELAGHRFIERIRDDSESPGSASSAGSATPADPGALWPIALGQRQRVIAPPSPVDPRRPMVLRAYVAMPPRASGSIQLRVDDRAFSALALAPVQMLEIAVSPGAHEVVVDAPAGAEAFLSLSPVDAAGGQRARIRVLRPVWERGQATRYLVPAWYRGLPVRVTLQVTVPETADRAEPVYVRLQTDTGHTRTIAVAVDALDASRIPVDSATPVSAAVRTVLWLPADAQSFWLEPVHPDTVSQIWASVALRQPVAGMAVSSAAGAAATGEPGDATQPSPAGGTAMAERAQARTWAPGDPEWIGHLNEIAALSRALVAAPDAVLPRLRRALRLLDIAELGHARMDWSVLSAVPPERMTEDERVLSVELAQRMSDWRDTRYLPPQPELPDHAVALTPAAMTLASDRAQLDDWQPASLAARRGDRTLLYATAQERDTPVARFYQAELLRSQGAHDEAARKLRALYEETGAIAIGIEALHAFEAALAERKTTAPAQAGSAMPADLASLAYGLALAMRERFAHPVIQRVLVAAAERSRWEPLRGPEASAGFESLRVDEELLDPEPDALLERALLAPPWPQEQARVVHPGRGALLALDLGAPARIQPQAWCQRIRGEHVDTASRCSVRWRVNSGPSQESEVPFAQATPLGSIALSKGHHEVEVVLDERDPTIRLAVRFATNRAIARETTPDGSAIAILRPGRMHVADAQHPVEATVLGPTTIRVEARHYMDEPPITLAVEARPERASEPAASIVRQVRVDAAQDPSASGAESRGVRLSRASTTVLVLPAPGVYRLTLRPQDGRALVRLWHRRDVPAVPLALEPAPEIATSLPSAEASSGLVMQPGTFASGQALGGALWQTENVSTWPTLSVGLSFRRDELAERDLEDEPLGNRFQLDVAWRRQLVPDRFWLRVESALRWSPGSQPAYGTSLDLVWRRLPLGLRVDAMGRVYAQSAGDVFAWSAQSRLRVGRSFRLQPSLTLLPALAVQARSYSLAPGADAILDPLVFNQYDVSHRSGLRPEATLFWQPLQDQLGLVRARYVTNEDFYSADRAEIELAWRGVGPWPRTDIPLFELQYRPGLRFADEHRDRSYVRHDLGLRLDWSLWNGKSGRWLLEVRDEVYLSTVVGNRNVFLLGVRYDAVDGRGLRDMLPIEYRFDDLIEPPPWAN